ncbi:CHAD domain-containing protein [Vibrio salinus]|uniref:CHAD domain-containing protein n=1 Tax=Vibrio salinus TaxID=2899784 RepID=UPI001E5B13CD|nr:CHAD domain-containing protein [Vibrio salinus]MCE0492898.1 CHAD domain-containing protein [Vibrio salinus]
MKSIKRFINGHLDIVHLQYCNLCNHQSDSETIHQIRVSIRHLNATRCILYKTDISEKNKEILKNYQKISKHLFETLSHPRDLEVQIRLAQSIQTNLDHRQPDITLYIDKLRNEERTLTGHLINTINQQPIVPAITALKQSLKSYKFKREYLVEEIHRQYKKTRKQLKASLNRLNTHPESFHKTRVKLKKYRYILELEAHLFNKKNTRLKTLKAAQNKLGNTNDLFIAAKLMTQHSVNSEVIEYTKLKYQTSLSNTIHFLFTRKNQYL